MEELIKTLDLNKDYQASLMRLDELKQNRHPDDIPMNDEYWKAITKHREAFKDRIN